MTHLWNAGVRIAKKVKFALKSKTTIEAKMKASIKAYGVAITAEELVKTDVTALRYKLDGDDDMGMILGTFFLTAHFVLNMNC